MADAFRDAITSVVDGWEPSGLPLADCADRVLAMPEMEAIRAYLLAERDGWCCDDCWKVDANTGERRLPESVIDWVTS